MSSTNEKKSKINAQDKYNKSRMFNFKGFTNETVVVQSKDLDYNNPLCEYSLECKKCKKILDITKDSCRKDIRCCKEKKKRSD